MIRLPSFGPQLFMRRNRGGISLDADALTLFAAMSSEPDATRKTLISDTIVALKNAGIWAKLDELWFLAAHAEQAALLGWKRYKDCAAVNAPSFEVDRGFTGDGSTSYLNTNAVPSELVQYALNDASFGVYNRTDGGGDSWGMATSQDDDSRMAAIMERNSAGTLSRARINQANTGAFSPLANPQGLVVARRTASNATQMFHNGALVQTDSQASTDLSQFAFFIGARNRGGTPVGFATRQYAFAFAGASLSEDQQEDLYEIVTDYLTAIGANV